MLRAKLLLLLTALLVCVSPGLAQPPSPSPTNDPRHIDASAFDESIDISSIWIFSPNDQPGNASPTLDDRSWITLTDKQSQTYDFHNISIGWYRIHVHLPPKARNVVLEVGFAEGEYQVFANGVQIAGPETLEETSDTWTPPLTNYRIPDNSLRDSRGDLVLALRVDSFLWPGHRKFGPRLSTNMYLASAAAAPRDASYFTTHAVLPELIEGALAFLVAFVALALYLAMRSRREYLAAAVTLFLTAALELVIDEVWMARPYHSTVAHAVRTTGVAILNVAMIEFVRLVLSRRLTRGILATEVIVFLGSLATILSFAVSAMSKAHVSGLLNYGSSILADVLVLALLIPACRRRNIDALVLLPILCISFVDDFWSLFVYTLDSLQHPVHLGSLPSLHVASYVFSFRDLDSLFYPAGILLFLVLRTLRIARERQRAVGELEAAHTMQQLLLARSSEPTPGFDVESIYLPASEVGGDFFLVSPDPHDGSITALVGDVSGKGLQAAMRVSMILGILRREDSREPATILFRLNQALVSQGGVGFTTACCVRLENGGDFTIANAGHISPYINGGELQTSPGLPLGLASGQEYDELSGHLAPGAHMVLMSDGVVEARSKKGELYGFDRLAALTLSPAREIASIAQAFGQDDDITVLTLACKA